MYIFFAVIFQVWRDYASEQRRKREANEISDESHFDLGSHTIFSDINSEVLSQNLRVINDESYSDTHWRPTAGVLSMACLIHRIYFTSSGSMASYSDELRRSIPSSAISDEKIQNQLNQAVEDNNIADIASAIEHGAHVSQHHWDITSRHLHDSYFPILALLLSASWGLTMTCLAEKNKESIEMKCHNPLAALLLCSHFHRWEKGHVTSRELSQLANDEIIGGVIGSKYQSIVLWRSIVLQLVWKKKQELKSHFCYVIPFPRGYNTVKDEINERTKRLRAIKYRSMVESFGEYYDLEDDVMNEIIAADKEEIYDDIYGIGNYIYPNKGMKQHQPHDKERHRTFITENGWTAAEDEQRRRSSPFIYPTNMLNLSVMLKEYGTLQLTLNLDIKTKRTSQLRRDELLLRNGFIRQARQDFLLLREAYKTPQQLVEERKQIVLQKKLEKKTCYEMDRERHGRMLAAGVSLQKPKKSKSEISKRPSRFKAANNKYLKSLMLENDEISEASIPIVVGEDESEEQEFQHRSGHYRNTKHPFFVEIFNPREFDDDDKDIWRLHTQGYVREVFISRRQTAGRNVMPRLLSYLKNRYHINTPISSISSWTVLSYLKNSPDCPRDARIWSELPKHYWDVESLSIRLDREIHLLEANITSLSYRLEDMKDQRNDIMKQRTNLMQFMREQRQQILNISIKHRTKGIKDKEDSRSICQKATSAANQVTRLRANIRSLKDEIKRSEYMFAASNIPGVFEAFGMSVDDRQAIDLLLTEKLGSSAQSVIGNIAISSTTGSVGYGSSDDINPQAKDLTNEANPPSTLLDGSSETGSISIYQNKKRIDMAAMILMEKKRTILSDLEKTLTDVLVEKRLADIAVECFAEFSGRSNQWLQRLAQSKLLMIMDSYEILCREKTNDEQLRKQSSTFRKLIKTYSDHLTELRSQKKYFIEEGERIQKIEEELRFTELMRRTGHGEANDRYRSFDANESIASSIETSAQLSDELDFDEDLSQSMSILSIGDDRDETGRPPHANHRSSDYSLSLQFESSPRKSKQMKTYHSKPRPSKELKLQDTDFSGKDISMNDHFKNLMNEENMKESITDELRDQILKEYWLQADPKTFKELAKSITGGNIHRLTDNDPSEKMPSNARRNSLKMNIITSESIKVLGRTAKMWKSVAEDYWRRKAELVRNILQRERQQRALARNLLFNPSISDIISDQSVIDTSQSVEIDIAIASPANLLKAKKETESNASHDSTIEYAKSLQGNIKDKPDKSSANPSRRSSTASNLSMAVYRDDNVWKPTHEYKLSVSFSAEEHPDKMSSALGDNTNDNKSSNASRGGRNRPVDLKRQAFMLPDPFAYAGMAEFNRIKASILHLEQVTEIAMNTEIHGIFPLQREMSYDSIISTNSNGTNGFSQSTSRRDSGPMRTQSNMTNDSQSHRSSFLSQQSTSIARDSAFVEESPDSDAKSAAQSDGMVGESPHLGAYIFHSTITTQGTPSHSSSIKASPTRSIANSRQGSRLSDLLPQTAGRYGTPSHEMTAVSESSPRSQISQIQSDNDSISTQTDRRKEMFENEANIVQPERSDSASFACNIPSFDIIPPPYIHAASYSHDSHIDNDDADEPVAASTDFNEPTTIASSDRRPSSAAASQQAVKKLISLKQKVFSENFPPFSIKSHSKLSKQVKRHSFHAVDDIKEEIIEQKELSRRKSSTSLSSMTHVDSKVWKHHSFKIKRAPSPSSSLDSSVVSVSSVLDAEFDLFFPKDRKSEDERDIFTPIADLYQSQLEKAKAQAFEPGTKVHSHQQSNVAVLSPRCNKYSYELKPAKGRALHRTLMQYVKTELLDTIRGIREPKVSERWLMSEDVAITPQSTRSGAHPAAANADRLVSSRGSHSDLEALPENGPSRRSSAVKTFRSFHTPSATREDDDALQRHGSSPAKYHTKEMESNPSSSRKNSLAKSRERTPAATPKLSHLSEENIMKVVDSVIHRIEENHERLPMIDKPRNRAPPTALSDALRSSAPCLIESDDPHHDVKPFTATTELSISMTGRPNSLTKDGLPRHTQKGTKRFRGATSQSLRDGDIRTMRATSRLRGLSQSQSAMPDCLDLSFRIDGEALQRSQSTALMNRLDMTRYDDSNDSLTISDTIPNDNTSMSYPYLVTDKNIPCDDSPGKLRIVVSQVIPTSPKMNISGRSISLPSSIRGENLEDASISLESSKYSLSEEKSIDGMGEVLSRMSLELRQDSARAPRNTFDLNESQRQTIYEKPVMTIQQYRQAFSLGQIKSIGNKTASTVSPQDISSNDVSNIFPVPSTNEMDPPSSAYTDSTDKKDMTMSTFEIHNWSINDFPATWPKQESFDTMNEQEFTEMMRSSLLLNKNILSESSVSPRVLNPIVNRKNPNKQTPSKIKRGLMMKRNAAMLSETLPPLPSKLTGKMMKPVAKELKDIFPIKGNIGAKKSSYQF